MNKKEWYVLIQEQKQGPYSYAELLDLIQNAQVYEYNYVWAPHLENWTLVAELQEFSHDRMRNLIISNSEVKTAFKQRKHERIDIEIPIFAHNRDRIFLGKTTSLSLGGASFFINDPLIYPGNQLIVHFSNAEKSFRVRAEVLRKSFVSKKISAKSSLQYAVRFLEKQNITDQLIQDLINSIPNNTNNNLINKMSA